MENKEMKSSKPSLPTREELMEKVNEVRNAKFLGVSDSLIEGLGEAMRKAAAEGMDMVDYKQVAPYDYSIIKDLKEALQFYCYKIEYDEGSYVIRVWWKNPFGY